MSVQFTSQSVITGRPRYVVQLCRDWTDTPRWHTVNYLEAAVWYDDVAPNMSTAHLTWDAGRMLRSERPAGVPAAFYDFGFIPDNLQAAQAFLENKLDGRLVRICVVIPPTSAGGVGQLAQKWIGVVVANGQARYGYEDAAAGILRERGLQTLTCYGLEHLLNLSPIQKAYVVNREIDEDGYVAPDPLIDSELAKSEWVPDFNRTHGRGGARGNMCTPPLVGDHFALPGNDPTGVKLETFLNAFADDNGPRPEDPNWQPPSTYGINIWSDQQKVNYLLFFFQPYVNADWVLFDELPPDPLPLQFMSVTADRLYGRRTITRVQGRTVWDILNELANPALGLGWRIDCPNAEQTDAVAEVKFFTHFSADLSAGGVIIPGNSDVHDLTIGDKRTLEQCAVQENRAGYADRIEVLGERIVVCCSVSYADGTLEKAWSDSAETAYKEAGKKLANGTLNPAYDALPTNVQALLNDQRRGDDRLGAVFTRFKMPDDWDWEVGDGEGGGGWNPTRRYTDRNGAVWTGASPSFGWRHRRPLLRWLPLYEDVNYADPAAWDYSTIDPLTGLPVAIPGVIPRPYMASLRVPLVFVYHAAGGVPEMRWRLAEINEAETPGAHVGVSADAMHIKVDFGPNHLLAHNHWTGAEPTEADPEVGGFDWQELIATIALELDTRLKVEEVVNPLATPGQERVRTIEVPGAQVWVVVPNTVVGIDADGALLRVPADTVPVSGHWARGVVRNDYPMLVAVATVCAAWLRTTRHNVVLTAPGTGIPGLSPYGSLAPGQMLRWLDPGTPQATAVNSPVTRVMYDNTTEAGALTLFAGAANVNPLVVAQRGVI